MKKDSMMILILISYINFLECFFSPLKESKKVFLGYLNKVPEVAQVISLVLSSTHKFSLIYSIFFKIVLKTPNFQLAGPVVKVIDLKLCTLSGNGLQKYVKAPLHYEEGMKGLN